jgi:hypothetical protein
MNNKCPNYGIRTFLRPGQKHTCEVCSEVLIAQERQGRAWLPAHELKRPVHVMPYQHHYRGAK